VDAKIKLNNRMMEVRWSTKGSCRNSGCPDPDCVCALCAKPIGIPEEDPRRADHDNECCGCAICEDDIPMILFRCDGKNMKQAAFHNACFQKVIALDPVRVKE